MPQKLMAKKGIKTQAFSVQSFEKAYLCCSEFDNFATYHTFSSKGLAFWIVLCYTLLAKIDM